MLDYHGRVAGITQRDNVFRYVIAVPHGGSLEISALGEVDLKQDITERLAPLLGCRCVYGINSSQYHRKRLCLADDLAASDPEQFLWEISRSATESIDNYFYSLLKLQPTQSGISIECLSINHRKFSEIGELFDRNRLTLDKMVFEPEAIRQCIKPLASDERTVLLHLAGDGTSLQMFRHGQLVASETMRAASMVPDAPSRHLSEEIGVLLMSAFGGRPVRKNVTLFVAGDYDRLSVSASLRQSMPFDFKVHDFPFDRLKISPGNCSSQQLHDYFSPLTLCYVYNKSQKCALSPEKNAVWS